MRMHAFFSEWQASFIDVAKREFVRRQSLELGVGSVLVGEAGCPPRGGAQEGSGCQPGALGDG